MVRNNVCNDGLSVDRFPSFFSLSVPLSSSSHTRSTSFFPQLNCCSSPTTHKRRLCLSLSISRRIWKKREKRKKKGEQHNTRALSVGRSSYLSFLFLFFSPRSFLSPLAVRPRLSSPRRHGCRCVNRPTRIAFCWHGAKTSGNTSPLCFCPSSPFLPHALALGVAEQANLNLSLSLSFFFARSCEIPCLAAS